MIEDIVDSTHRKGECVLRRTKRVNSPLGTADGAGAKALRDVAADAGEVEGTRALRSEDGLA